jgi:hypothetical protein
MTKKRAEQLTGYEAANCRPSGAYIRWKHSRENPW